MATDYHSEPFHSMVAIGDSITMGASATRREYCWVSRLARLISEFQKREIEVCNAGIGGNLISRRSIAYNHHDSGKPSALERYKRDVISHAPDLVVISYGLNDMRCGTPVDIFLEDMDVMVKAIQMETKAVIVMLNAYFMTGFKEHSETWGHGDMKSTQVYNARMRQYAEINDVLYADVYSAQGQATWAIDKDGVHPNNLGHALIANKVFETIATHCSCLSINAFEEAEDYYRWADESEVAFKNYGGI